MVGVGDKERQSTEEGGGEGRKSKKEKKFSVRIAHLNFIILTTPPTHLKVVLFTTQHTLNVIQLTPPPT